MCAFVRAVPMEATRMKMMCAVDSDAVACRPGNA